MKKFILSEMLLLSTKEKKARKVIFNPSRTIILGKNETGKSSLLKSIYSTFGATPSKQNSKWTKVSLVSIVSFLIDNIEYKILKDGKLYAVFDCNNNLLNLFDSVTEGLGPFLADLLDFKIKLPNQNGELITPPPAFLFLPFYIDQDASWQEGWKSFANLQQIKNYKRSIIEYHTGVKPNEYYEITGEIGKNEEIIQNIDQEQKLSKSLLEKIKERLSEIDFTIDIDDFKEEIKDLLIECQTLKVERDKIKNRLVDYFNIKIQIESQIEIVKHTLNEVRKDYNYAVFELIDGVDCPTCGTHYENSFSERFEIAKDENICKDLFINLNHELIEVDSKIEKENQLLNQKSQQLLKVEEILENKRGEVKLRDLIENEGKKELKKIFQQKIYELKLLLHENYLLQQQLKKRLKALENIKRKQNIKNDYLAFMRHHLKELSVNLSENDYKDFTKNISNTGSALPRSLTAYYISILEIIQKYGSSAFCPIVIDSPNQQAQDIDNIKKILVFIKDFQPKESQLILGLEEDFGIDFGSEIIYLKDKYSLLQESEYDLVYEELTPYLDKMWSVNNKGKLFK